MPETCAASIISELMFSNPERTNMKTNELSEKPVMMTIHSIE